jgi:hypothetical protein
LNSPKGGEEYSDVEVLTLLRRENMAENNICNDCGYEGPEGPGEGRCPMCGGDMVPADDLEEDLENGDLNEDGEEELEGEDLDTEEGEEEGI